MSVCQIHMFRRSYSKNCSIKFFFQISPNLFSCKHFVPFELWSFRQTTSITQIAAFHVFFSKIQILSALTKLVVFETKIEIRRVGDKEALFP